jgi:TonB family protein
MPNMPRPNKATIAMILLLGSLKWSYGQQGSRDIEAGGFILSGVAVDPEMNALYCSIGIGPIYPGGTDSLVAFARRNIRYTDAAVQAGSHGRVVLEFTVDTAGYVVDEKVIRGIRNDLDSMCLSMLQKIPRWEPATVNGKAVIVRFNWSVLFSLAKRKED